MARLRFPHPRNLATRLRELARRRPAETADYLEAHPAEWTDVAEHHPADAADILEAITGQDAAGLISDLEPGDAADVLEEMHDQAAAEVLTELPASEAAEAMAALAPDEAADIVPHLGTETREAIFEAMAGEQVDEIRDILRYPPDSAGGLMTPDPATLTSGLTSGEAIEALRRLHEGLEHVNYVYVVTHEARLVGVISFRELVFARPLTAIDEVMIHDPISVQPETDREEVSALIQRYDLLALPVVDADGVLLGIVTVDNVIEAVQREASEDIAALVGAGTEETLYTSPLWSVRHRLPWLVLNLGTALLVALTISRFEPVLDRLTILAAYMPVVASMGGNAGAQSLAVLIRSMAVEGLPAGRVRRVVGRQVITGLLNGMAVGILSGLVALIFTGEPYIGLVVALAAQVNLIAAGFAGAGIPILLERVGKDPALGSNILITAITDLVGFGGFLAIATLLL